jgi:hypothetical protein
MPETMNDVCPTCLKRFETEYLTIQNDGTVVVSEGWGRDDPNAVRRRYHIGCAPE